MPGEDWRERQRVSFGAAAQVYERARPGYPPEAVDLLLAPAARRVADVGAGTGKFTRLLVAAGLDVVAVEPDARMRAEFARVLPDVPVLEGSAEALPFEDGSVDAVVVAQAWHWVDPARAMPELARVLRPGGGLGVVWNERTLGEPWVDALEELIRQPPQEAQDVWGLTVGPPFGPVERHELVWRQELAPEAVVELVASRSYAIALDPPQRARLLAAVRRLLDGHPDTAGREVLSVPYRTLCYRALLPA
jgi:SAM-dependent methyltransferase